MIALFPPPGAAAQQSHRLSGATVDTPPETVVQERPVRKAQTRVSLSVRDSTVRYVVRELIKRAGLRQIYSNNAKFDKRVTVNLKDVPVMDALARVLANIDYVAEITPDGTTVLVRAKPSAVTDSGCVTGTVKDSATGKPIAGARIALQGTKLATMTSAAGRFVFTKAPVGNYALTATIFGYRKSARDVAVVANDTASISFLMSTVPTMLSQVVTTATGEKSLRELGSDITVLNVDSIMKIAPIRNMTDLLETRVPGLTVQHTSGVPGAPSRIRLRGIGGGLLKDGGGATNDPIIVVDGHRIYSSQSAVRDQNLAPAINGPGTYNTEFPPPSSLDQIDPNAIESVQILKGPSATAAWGPDAANGVIAIRTKRGKPGPTHYTATLNAGIDYMPGFYAPPGYYPFGGFVGGGYQYGHLCAYNDPTCTVDSLVRFQALNEKRLSSIARGDRADASVGMSGGSEAMTYYVQASGTSQMGMFKMPDLYQDLFRKYYKMEPPSWMKRPTKNNTWAGRISLELHPRPGMRTTIISGVNNSANLQGNATTGLSSLASGYLDTLNIPRDTLSNYSQKVTSHSTVFDNSISLDWGTPNFPWTTTLGLNTSIRDDRSLIPYGLLKSQTYGYDSLGFFSTGRGTSEYRSVDTRLTTFKASKMPVVFGLNVTRQSTGDFQAIARTLPIGAATAQTFDQASQSVGALTTAGWTIEPQFNVSSRFFVIPAINLAGGSNSGSHGGVNGGAYALFPKIQTSWIAIDHEGEEGGNVFAINLLRPRVAFGIAGVQPDPTAKLRLADHAGTVSPIPGLILQSIGNTQIHPERSREIEFGFDMRTFHERLSLTATYFNKLRLDALSSIPLAPSAYGGYLKQTVNIGKVRNSGTEFTADVNFIQTARTTFNMTASMSSNTNVLLKLNGNEPYISLEDGVGGGGTRLIPGYPIDGRWARPIVGYRAPGPSGRLGNSDIIVADSAIYIGQESPKFTLPFAGNLSLLGGAVSMHATFQYQSGATQIANGGRALLENQLSNPNATLGQQAAALAAMAQKTDYGLIQTVNTLRFQSMSVNYNVPRSFTRRLRVPYMSVALQGSNLGLWSNYRGKDPNVNAYTVGDQIADSGQLPEPRTVSVQFNFTN